MPARLLCSQGHQWDSDQGDAPCPVCGAAPVPPELAETLPPTAQPVPPNEVPTLAPGEAPSSASLGIPADLIDHPKYRAEALLGIGGMGVVFKAEHKLMERAVALKVINRELTSDTAAIKRFHREVKAVARLNHPSIVTAYDAEQVGDTHFLVMEYVKGESLARVVAQRGPLPVAMACDCIRQAAAGLQHAHELGHIHRDIKPQNLMLTPEGQVKILDFGLARLATASRAAEPHAPLAAPSKLGRENSLAGFLTQAGVVMGTPDYIAPEQVEDPRLADIRADIYSLGCTFYHLLSGRVPFSGGSVVDKLVAHQERTPEPITSYRQDVPGEVASILERMLAKRPADRYQTPGEVARALEQITQRGKSFTRPSGGRPVPSVLPATANVQPSVSAFAAQRLAEPAVAPVRRTNWRMLFGCLVVGLILIAASVLGVVIGVQALIKSVSNAVQDVSKLITEERGNDQLWAVIDGDWQPPPADLTLDQLFPRNLDMWSRARATEQADLDELDVKARGRRAEYEQFGRIIVIYAMHAPKEKQEGLFAEIEAACKEDEKSFRASRTSSNANARRFNASRGLPVEERIVVWTRSDWMFIAIGPNAENPDPLLISLLRALGKKSDAR